MIDYKKPNLNLLREAKENIRGKCQLSHLLKGSLISECMTKVALTKVSSCARAEVRTARANCLAGAINFPLLPPAAY